MQPNAPLNSSQAWLLAEFERIKARNNRFTLRAMASRLKLSPGRLSEFLSGKRTITPKAAAKVADHLGLNPRRREEFLNTTSRSKGKIPVVRKSYRRLELDHFSVIADWYHFALLSLIETVHFKASEPWIAKRLGLSVLQVKSAVGRLQRVQLLQIDDGKTWISTGRHLETPSDTASSALKKSHRQDLKRAIEALDDVPIEERDITSMTMAIDVRKIEEAKNRIREFRKDMAAFLEEGEATEVYSLNVQLIPLTKKLRGDD